MFPKPAPLRQKLVGSCRGRPLFSPLTTGPSSNDADPSIYFDLHAPPTFMARAGPRHFLWRKRATAAVGASFMPRLFVAARLLRALLPTRRIRRNGNKCNATPLMTVILR